MLPSVFTKKTLYQESVLRRPRTPPCAGVDILQYEEVAVVGEELKKISFEHTPLSTHDVQR